MSDADVTRPTGVAPDSGRVAWFHCFSGIAGDMALGSLLDAGADLREVLALLRRLPVGGWDLTIEPVLRGGVAATRAIVEAQDDGVGRTHRDIVALLEAASLPERVTRRALAVFERLAQVEAALHRRPVAEVHFHEVGGHDALVDIVGTVAALEVLDIDEVTVSSVAVGTGMVRAAHGLLPNPAPATVRLLAGFSTYGRDTRIELTTPTGAALLAALATSSGPMPPMAVAASGFGAGAGELEDLPNCTQVVLGTRHVATVDGGQPVVTLEVNLDDVTGEQVAHTLSALLDAGAHDAWVSPVVMKKGRPGHVVHALADPALVAPLRQLLVTATGSFGVRATLGERWPRARRLDQVLVEGRPVQMKVGHGRAKAEFADVAAVAAATGLTLREVDLAAQAAWRDGAGAEPG